MGGKGEAGHFGGTRALNCLLCGPKDLAALLVDAAEGPGLRSSLFAVSAGRQLATDSSQEQVAVITVC